MLGHHMLKDVQRQKIEADLNEGRTDGRPRTSVPPARVWLSSRFVRPTIYRGMICLEPAPRCFPRVDAIPASRRLESIQARRAAAKQANRDAARERKAREAAQEAADRMQTERNNIAVSAGRGGMTDVSDYSLPPIPESAATPCVCV